MIRRNSLERRGELGFNSVEKSGTASDRGGVLADTSKARCASSLSMATFDILVVLSNDDMRI
jgi:hypothetical protein